MSSQILFYFGMCEKEPHDLDYTRLDLCFALLYYAIHSYIVTPNPKP